VLNDKLSRSELETARKSKSEFRKELRFLTDTSELFLKTFEVLSKKDVQRFTHSQDASYRISYRIFRLLRCAIGCSLEGYYDVSLALLRIAYENHLLMNYLSKNEEEARLWFEGKRFAPSHLRQNVSYASNSLYQEMSEYIHSSFKSTISFTISESGRTKATLGEYSRKQFHSVLNLKLMSMATTIIWLSLTFAQELKEHKEWHSMFSQTVPEMWKYMKKAVMQKE
jgi:hypothetical protein